MARSVAVWWKPSSPALAPVEAARIQSELSATAVIIYCGLAIGANGTLVLDPPTHEPAWGHWENCDAAVAAASTQGLGVQLIVEGRMSESGPVSAAVARGGGAFGAELIARLQLLSNRRHVTGLNLDIEQDSHTNLTQVAFDNFTAALADEVGRSELQLTACVGYAPTERDFARSRRVGRIAKLYAMNLYHATSALEWRSKLFATLNASGPSPTDAVVAGFSLTPKYGYENTSTSVAERFAAAREAGVQHIALFAYTAREDSVGYHLPKATLAAWSSELRKW